MRERGGREKGGEKGERGKGEGRERGGKVVKNVTRNGYKQNGV